MASTKADFSQNNPAWRNNLLGKSTWETIGQYGCVVTSMANVAQAHGVDLNPYTMNIALRKKNLFVKDQYGQLADTAGYHVLASVSPRTAFVETKYWAANVVAPYAYFDVRSSVNTEIIVMIDYHPERSGLQNHYCRVIGLNGAKNDIEIVDSWDGKRKWLSSIAKLGGKRANQIIWSAGKYRRI